jgi:hypothetical protein
LCYSFKVSNANANTNANANANAKNWQSGLLEIQQTSTTVSVYSKFVGQNDGKIK